MISIKAIAHKVTEKKGFAMLFAVLVSSVILSVGVSIFNLTLKELVLSSSGRESQFAFYAADSGIECAIYWDFKGNTPNTMYATSSVSEGTHWRDSFIDGNNPSVGCIGQSLAAAFKTPVSISSTNAVTRFQLTIPNTDPQGASAPYCAIVEITKDMTGLGSTMIQSRGYNTACDSTDQTRIERALKVTY